MKEAKHAIVINQAGNKVKFVITESVMVNGRESITPLYYTLNEGEKLVFEQIEVALSMIKPRWNGMTWEETATPEEIAAAQPEPIKPQPSDIDIALLAIAEIYEMISGGAA